MKRILLFAASLLAFVGCEEQNADNTGNGEEGKTEKISVAPTEIVFEKEGGDAPVIVTSTGDWTLSSDETNELIKTDITSGKDGDIVTFKAEANETGEEIVVDYTFKTGETGEATAPLKVILRSGELTTMTLASAPEVEVGYDTERIEVLLNTNLNYRTPSAVFSFAEREEGWLSHYTNIKGDNKNEVKMYFNLTRNTGDASRTATITISGGEGIEPVTVEVTQRPQPSIVPAVKEYIFKKEGGSYTFNVTANVEYDVTAAPQSPTEEDWLKVETGEAGAVTISAEASEEKRYAVLTFTEKNPLEGVEPVTATVNVRQVQSALIQKAIDMTAARVYPPVWDGNTEVALTDCKKFTFEALIKCNDFKEEGSISTIMGIEQHFLVCIGDSDIKSNQLQVATAGEKLTNVATCLLEKDKWYHIAVTFDTGNVKVYLNGEEAVSGTVEVDNVNIPVSGKDEFMSNRNFWIGYSVDPKRDFKGTMSEIRIWNKVLTSEEINAENHFYTVAAQSDGLQCYWKLDGSLKDYTGKTNTLKFENNIVLDWDNGVGQEVAEAECPWVEVSLPE